MTIDEVTRGGVSHVGVALTFGLVVMAMIYALGDKSGAHINPAVTIAFACSRFFSWKQTTPYILSQCSGALAASYLLKWLFPASLLLGATLPVGSDGQSFVLEFILTFLLMLVILSSRETVASSPAQGSKEQGLFAGIAIGGVVALEALFAGPISGASMNPARSLAPAIASDHFQSLWLYLTAPVLGAVTAAGVYKLIK